MKEKDIENDILVWLNMQPETFAFKVNTAGFYDVKRKMFRKNLSRFVLNGTADILGISHQKFIAIEVKTPTTIRRFLHYPHMRDKNQQAFLDKVNKMGGIGKCVSSLDEVMMMIMRLSPKDYV